MDKQLREFTTVSALILIFFFTILSVFGYIYKTSSISLFNAILAVLIFATAFATILLSVVIVSLYRIYRMRQAGPIGAWAVRIGLKVILPLTELLAGFIKIDKDIIRNLCIDINNIIVKSKAIKYAPYEVLVVLPHCLQNSECGYKVTTDINNCKACGRCNIGDFLKISKGTGVDIKVVTGGTVARNVISRVKPRIILSVACERDLASGISDVSTIPVIGILNQRPNGPCHNTSVIMEEFNEAFYNLIDVDANK